MNKTNRVHSLLLIGLSKVSTTYCNEYSYEWNWLSCGTVWKTSADWSYITAITFWSRIIRSYAWFNLIQISPLTCIKKTNRVNLDLMLTSAPTGYHRINSCIVETNAINGCSFHTLDDKNQGAVTRLCLCRALFSWNVCTACSKSHEHN